MGSNPIVTNKTFCPDLKVFPYICLFLLLLFHTPLRRVSLPHTNTENFVARTTTLVGQVLSRNAPSALGALVAMNAK